MGHIRTACVGRSELLKRDSVVSRTTILAFTVTRCTFRDVYMGTRRIP
jgi:hypothetical protein